ncbi:filamentous hemagglutinin N-terminal domain-containing protein [Escherichia coli]|uniref:Filamentous hemagglutinin N-terminal domain-containing protein n=6 Tax=Escherichia coli TaxID=562 RepID=A0AAJ3D0N1_ECOLX|nr:filamentous hemagglutinin N-terminal domain-containing protein [Escherichia coli]EFN6769686.1 filamentous hemagglutinin N-terminal domain-containing protein [Escherichia coli O39:H21]EEZ3876909.1 filamentous hemagglutinin N-terminal domain-containing protein [Escherichia coli]EFA4919563.1 filamentous hemagglutinin N-terminal domain-containing protein [Escherichia coli]EFA4973429.1 filamentous hemagglutinin N-terminal domain-containing protein [Escherichia coli]
MNRNCYRIIFNKARGMLMVVADIARSGRAGASPSSRTGYPRRQRICRVTPLAFSLWLASGMVHSVSAAGIVADHGAPGHQQPTITQTASGIPQVNIQTPSAGGVSHNTYSQFDVGNQGVILNNAHNNVQTQLGGMVAGNPWLAKGEARIILNEVNSRNPSQLNGFVEVAGKKAQVVIANPSGISCDGCGFINANRATLTTGQPQMKNGSLTGFSVERGEIQVTGKGMDASRTDYTDIIARSVKINAGIWAQDLKVTTGRNNVDIAHGQTEKKAADASSQPQVALDVASLGGMYAGKIRLVGTETGVGVRNAGHIGAQAGAVTLTADGRIENSGSISAKTDVHLATTRELHNSGSVYAGQDTQIQSDGAFTHTGSVASRRNTRIQTTRLTGSERSLLAAGVKDDGRLAEAGNLTVSTTGELAAHGQVLSGGDMQLKGQGLDLGNSRIQGQHTELNATSGNLSTQNAQLSAGTLSARTAGQFSNNGGTINADTLQISAQSLSNRKGSLIQTGTGDFSLSLPGSVDNREGLLAANGAVRLDALRLDNRRGKVQAAQSGSLQVKTTGAVDNQQGRLLASSDILINTQALNNDNGLISAAAGTGRIKTQQSVSNTEGRMESAGRLDISAGSLNNHQGTVVSDGLSVTLDGALDNTSGRLLSQKTLSVSGSELVSDDGLIQSGGDMTLDVQDGVLSNRNTKTRGGISSAGTLTVRAGMLNNQQGFMVGQKDMILNAGTLDNRQGVLGSQASLQISSGTLMNQKGALKAGTDMLLSGGDVSNQEGTLAAGGDLNTHLNVLENQQGTVVSNGNSRLDVTRFDNQGGRLVAQQSLTLSSTDIINDASGLIQSGASLNLRADTLSNRNSGDRGGVISQGAMTLNAGTLDSTAGVLLSGDALSLTAGVVNNTSGQVVANGQIVANGLPGRNSLALNNQSGLIQGKGISINTAGQTLDNRGGTLNSLQELTVSTGAMDNRGGTVGAKTTADLSTTSLDNREGGRLVSEGELRLHTGGLQNSHGQIQSVGDILFDSVRGVVDNVSGLIRSGSAITLNALQFINRHTQNTGQGLEAQTIHITTQDLDNQEGSILADRALTVMADRTLSNNDGVLSSGATLSVSGRQLTFSNRDGVVKAGQSVSVDAGQLGGDGKLLSLGDMTLKSNTTFSNSGQTIANGNLTLSVNGDVSNTGSLLAGSRLDLNSIRLENTEKGEISAGQTWLNVTDTLLNRGLIDGKYTHLQANTLTNSGTGRIYGDAVGVSAATFNNLEENGVAATLAGRERVDLGVQTLNNRTHSLIYSAGDMHTGGMLDANGAATGKAGVLNNHSATIEAAGYLVLSAGQINNVNDHFTTERVVVSTEKVTEYQLSGSDKRWSAGEPGVYVDNDSSNSLKKLHTPEGARDKFTQYDYTRTVEETRVKESDPGKILSGAGMTIVADKLLNDKSQVVAGGLLDMQAGDVENVSVSGERHVTDSGTSTYYYRIRKKGKDKQGEKTSQYTPPTVIQTITLKPGELTSHGQVQGSQVTLSPLKPQGTDVQTGLTGNVDATVAVTDRIPLRPVVSAGEPVILLPGQQFEVSAPQGSIHVAGPDTRLPDSSLFKTNPAVNVPYLVETDPRFTNQKTWLGSDYMQKAFSQNGDNMLKRLGDGFYEQRLIREQVVALTGQRYLDGYSNDEEQFKALMDAGIAFGKQYNLTPGVALTAEQMALLTGDIVWLVNTTVTLPDGSTQTVQVPQVYARVKPGDVNSAGALIAGRDMVMKLDGDLFNSGKLAGKQTVQLSAENIHNQAGTIQGANVSLTARTDISSTGGLLQATDSLLAMAGRDINLTTTTRTAQSDAGQNHFERTSIDSVAGVYVQNDQGRLVLQAGRDMNLTAATVVNQGKDSLTQLSAGRDMTLSTVTTSAQDNITWDKNNRLSQGVTQSTGSTLAGNGDVTLTAGRDMTSQAASLSAQKGLALMAGHDVTLTGAQNTSSLDEYHKVTGSSGMLSKTTTTTHDVTDRRTMTGSELNGDTVSIGAGHNLNVTGSSVAGDNRVSLAAGNNLSIGTLTESNRETHLKQEKKSGLMSSGGVGFSVGSQSLKVTDTATDTTQKGSTVGSVHGDVSLQAGNRLTVNGSDLIAGRDMALSGKEASITAATDQHVQTHTVEQKTSGLTLALSGTAGSALNTTVETVQAAKSAGNSRLEALQGVKAALSGAQAVQAGRLAEAQGNQKENNNAVGISLSYGSQSSKSEQQSEQTVAKGSTLTAGNNLSIQATGSGVKGVDGDLTIQGSQIKAGNNVLLQANRDVNLVSAENTSKLEGKNTSSGGSVGVGVGVGSGGWGISVSASANQGKGSEKGNGTTHTETTVDAGNRLTIISGRDTTLTGAQAGGETVKVDAGRHLTLTSEQDSDRYDSKQQNASAGGSFTFGSMSGSASVNLSRDKMHSNYDSVQEQTGIFAGRGGFDVTTGQHTQLNGAVIASTATADKNRLDTGTLGFSDIENRADFKTEHQSAGLSTGGSVAGNFLGNMANNLLVGANHEGHADSTTQSAVSAGNITIRDTQSQKQDVADLKRDAAHANQTLSPIFDREKEQQRLQQAQLIGEIGNQVADIARTEGQIAGEKAKRDPAALNQARAELEAAGKPYTEQDVAQRAYNNGMAASGFGTGGKYQQAIQAATAAVQGLAGGNLSAALAGGAAPYLAEVVKTMTTDPVTGEVNKAANVAAHAVVNAALAVAQGNNALAGAAGAATGEVVGIIATQMYGKPVSELSETEKQTVSTLATVAAGLAGGLVGDSGASAVAGAQSGKTTVENNFLGATSSDKLDKAIEKIRNGDKTLATANELIKLENADKRSDALVSKFNKDPSQLNSAERAELAAYLRVYASEMEKEYGTAVAQELVTGLLSGQDYIKRNPDTEAMAKAQSIMNTWGYHKSNASIGDAPLLFGGSVLGLTVKGMATNAAIGISVNSVAQLAGKDPFSYVDAIMAGVTAAATTGKGIIVSTPINMGGAAISSSIKGEDPTNSVIGAGAGSIFGGGIGKIATEQLKPVIKEGSAEVIGAVTGAVSGEVTGNQVKDKLDKVGNKNGSN